MCTCFLCYLLTMVTVLWFLKLGDIKNSLEERGPKPNNSMNGSALGPQSLLANESAEPRSFFSRIAGDNEVMTLSLFSISLVKNI